MNTNQVITIIVILVLIVGGIALLGGQGEVTPEENPSLNGGGSTTTVDNSAPDFGAPANGTGGTSDCPKLSASTITITYTNDQVFMPSCVTVAANTTVVWRNESAQTLAVGTDPHPVHTGNREVSNRLFKLDVPPDSSASVKLETKGTVGYHDHDHASSKGKIVVE